MDEATLEKWQALADAGGAFADAWVASVNTFMEGFTRAVTDAFEASNRYGSIDGFVEEFKARNPYRGEA